MDSLRIKRPTKRSFARTVISFVLLVILVLLSNATWRMYRSYKESVDRKQGVEEEYKELGDRIEDIKSRVESLETREGREAEIRRSFNVAKPGEQVAIVVPNEDKEDIKPLKQPWHAWLWRGYFIGVYLGEE